MVGQAQSRGRAKDPAVTAAGNDVDPEETANRRKAESQQADSTTDEPTGRGKNLAAGIGMHSYCERGLDQFTFLQTRPFVFLAPRRTWRPFSNRRRES